MSKRQPNTNPTSKTPYTTPHPPPNHVPRIPICHSLPPLHMPDFGEPVITLHVRHIPVTDRSNLLTWVVEQRPRRRIGYGQLVSLRTPDGQSGIGLIASATDLRRHWITWHITSDEATCKVQIPIPWSDLSGIEAAAHIKHYRHLPALPPPHKDDASARNCTPATTTYPYDTKIPPHERKALYERLETITKKRWQWGKAGKSGKM